MTAFKVGVLAISVAVAAVLLAFLLGVRKPPADTYHSYFDESVQGLDVGAPVKYRGVMIGSVSAIEIAPDRKHVDVSLVLERAKASELQLGQPSLLRARLAIQGVTGIKFIDLDFADAKVPVQVLPFPVAERYIPSRPSLVEDLGREVAMIARRLPPLLDRGTSALATLEGALGDFRAAKVPVRIAEVLEHTTDAVGDLRRLMAAIDRQQLPHRVAGTLARVDQAVDRLAGVISRIAAPDGVVDDAHRTLNTWNDLGRAAGDSTADLEQALREIRDAARSFRELVENLDRDPGVLVKGRARSNKP